PLLGMLLTPLVPSWLSPAIYLGFLYLCALPATVQSAIAFTSMAGGNVSAAVCSASASSILGIFLSPVLVGMMIHVQGEGIDTWHSIQSIMMQLMLPFVVGHLSRPLIGRWVDSHRPLIGKLDQSSILLVVYVAFSEAVVQGIWHQVGWYDLASIVLLSCVLLALVLCWNVWISRRLGFDKADEITIVFCGSKKSLANGVPMANVMFPAASVGVMVLPLMIFHQIQLMVCAVLARRYHEQGE
ncbi:MAG: bile acid:sodium symporter family protein, partial [Aeromonas veronii]